MVRSLFIWGAILGLIAVPTWIAATSPLLAYRDAIYIAAGLSGVIAMALLLLQPLLIAGVVPGLRGRPGRRTHRWIGATLVAAIIVHVGALWVTSPPDVIDALTFTSPTPFSLWGVLAMWGVFATALLAVLRHRLSPKAWRTGHLALAAFIVTGSVVHAVLIQGTMGQTSKILLCVAAGLATAKVLFDRRHLFSTRRPRA